MRIIHYSPGMRLELGGVVRAVLDSCAILAHRGHEVILLTFDAPDVPSDWDGRPGIPSVVRIPPARRPNGMLNRDSLAACRAVLSDGGVLHLHTPWNASNLQLARLAHRFKLPYVVSLHGMLNSWPMTRSTFKKRLFLFAGGRRCLTRAAWVHCTAEEELRQSQPWAPRARMLVLPYLIDLTAFDYLPGPETAVACYQIDQARPVLVYISRLHMQKGVDLLIAAAAIVRDSGPAFTLLIGGTGTPAYTQSLQDAIDAAHLRNQVKLVGMVRGEQKLSLYQAADLFVLPTLHENFGLVLAESLACGTSVLTTNAVNIWQDIGAAGGAILDAPAPSRLADAIKELLRDLPALRHRGRSGRAWVQEHWSAQQLAPRYEHAYASSISTSAQANDPLT